MMITTTTGSAQLLLVCGCLWAIGCGGDDEPEAAPDAPEAALDVALDVGEPQEEDTSEAPDIPEDEGPQDVELPWDLGPDFEAIERDPDVPDIKPGSFTDCPSLGISAKWKGTFEGIVTYDLEDTGEGVQQGLYLVGGDLSFEIACLDQKLLVTGTLKGNAEAAGQIGEHPFAANLFGDYNYIDRTIDATFIDGEVRLFKVVSVFFEGNFDGAVMQDGTFEGTWDGVHAGNDLDLEGDANGYGTWKASPAF